MKKNIKRAPTKDTIGSFKDINNFINKNASKDEKRVNNLIIRDKIKMPLKRYRGIKMHVLKKQNQEKLKGLENNILSQTHIRKKLMTHVIERREEDRKGVISQTKLKFSHNKRKSKFSDGVLKLNKNFLNYGSSNNTNGNNKFNNNKGKNNFFKK